MNEGMITVDGRRVTIESSGKMFRLMRGHCGGKIIRIDADPSLDVLCTKHGDKLFVSAANRCSEPEEFMIEGYRMLSGTQIETDGFSFKCNSFRVYETAEPVVKGHSVLFMWLEPAEQ